MLGSIALILLQGVDHGLGVLYVRVFRSQLLVPDVPGLLQVFQGFLLVSPLGVGLAYVVVRVGEVGVVDG